MYVIKTMNTRRHLSITQFNAALRDSKKRAPNIRQVPTQLASRDGQLDAITSTKPPPSTRLISRYHPDRRVSQ